MNRIFKFGEDVDGYDIKVLNEREIRAAAGMFFLLMFISIKSRSSLVNRRYSDPGIATLFLAYRAIRFQLSLSSK